MNEDVAAVVDVVALVLSGSALLLSGIDLWKQRDNPIRSPKIVLAICSLISFAGAAKSAWDVKVDYYD